MADAKQILVVDDHFEMLEFLRSMLELSNQDCEVRAVPSAEEGMLETMRTKFDLVISDVRLPGMSGFEFIRRLRRTNQETPVIMITAYSSDQGRKEAAELDVMKYFEKPLDTDDVLTAVHTALHGEGEPAIGDGAAKIATGEISNNVIKRLDTLRTDTGSIQLMLATNDGEVLYATGSQRLDLPPLAQIIARNINDSYALAERLGTKEPFTLQYHAGEQIELYCANVGEIHFLTLFFDAAARRGRIGTIWVFTQRAISDLQMMLTIETPVEAPIDDSLLRTPEPETIAKAEPMPKIPSPSPELPPAEPEPLPTLQLEQMEASESDLAALFANDGSEVDLDSFWDDASIEETTVPPTMTGMSIEEAREKGLLNLDFEEEEDGS